ncbi:MAG: YbbR-like domain-containing protein [Vicinamibacterales bacterium]
MAWHPFRNLPLKFLALVLATLLWLTIARDQVAERSMRVPLEFRNIPDTLEIVGESPSAVDVRVRGASSILSRLEPGEIVAVLDLRLARPGQRLFHVLTDEVRAPFGIEVSQVNPPTIAIQFERSGTRIVPVVPAFDGEPAPGFVAGPFTVNPPMVEVVGPQSRLTALREATTEPISLTNARADVTDSVTVGVADSALRLRVPRTAVVLVQIRPGPIDRALVQVPLGVKNLRRGLRAAIDPVEVTVTIRGERQAVGALDRDAVVAWVDAMDLGPGQYTLPVYLEAKGIGQVRSDPAEVQVRVR